jgi:acetyl-CoA C-acetyltransferase
VLSRQAPSGPLAQETSVQREADRRRGAVPVFATEATGTARIESFTAIYGRDNAIEHGVVMLRTPDNMRALARVPAHDRATLAHLLDMDRSPIGSSGAISRADDGMLEWRTQ